MSYFLGDKNVGDVVKVKENGTPANFIIVHKGRPSGLYDSSCDGIWLLREQVHSERVFSANKSNDYENSDIRAWLDGTYYNSIDSEVRTEIKQVKIPFKKGNGTASTGVQSGSNGLSCKVFLLSGYEVGFKYTEGEGLSIDGAKLSYFIVGAESDANSKRIAEKAGGSGVHWWSRTPYLLKTDALWLVYADGRPTNSSTANGTTTWVRPAFVVPSNLVVNSDGVVSTNTLPSITVDKAEDVGEVTDGITIKYSVDDADPEDSLTVTEYLDGVQKRQFAATRNAEQTISYTGNEWLKITNGTHTIKITCSDGKNTVENTVTFTRDQTSLSVKPARPMEADDTIRACSLSVKGAIPTDAVCRYLVTNNALDDMPIWEDCTDRVRAGFGYIFKNKEAKKGFAFSFDISIERGISGMGGYITEISGGFE